MMVQDWIDVLQTANLSGDRRLDSVSRWLIITRAAVLPMTLISALIGGLLAAATVSSAAPPGGGK